MALQLKIEQIGGNRPWVARITGPSEAYGLEREFMNGKIDYSDANRPKTRGAFHYFSLVDGIYEVKGGSSWGKANSRSFIRVVNGEQTKITMPDVLASFETPASAEETIE